MPLVKTALVNGLRKFMDAQYSSFDKFPQTANDAINDLIDAVDDYASNITPMSTTADAAKSAMGTILMNMNMGDYNKAIDAIQKGFTQYVTTLAGGMLTLTTGATIISNTLPQGNIPIDDVGNIGLNGGSSEDVANAIGTIADTWFKTGISTGTLNGVTSTEPWL